MTATGYVFAVVMIALGIYALTLMIEWLIIKRVMDSAADGFMVSLGLSCLVNIALWSAILGLSAGTVLLPVIAAAIIAALKLRAYRRTKRSEATGGDDAEVFR